MTTGEGLAQGHCLLVVQWARAQVFCFTAWVLPFTVGHPDMGGAGQACPPPKDPGGALRGWTLLADLGLLEAPATSEPGDP